MVQYNLIYNFENVHFTYTDIFLSCIKLNWSRNWLWIINQLQKKKYQNMLKIFFVIYNILHKILHKEKKKPKKNCSIYYSDNNNNKVIIIK